MSCPFASSSDSGIDQGNNYDERLNYTDYLQLDKLLDCQKLMSEEKGSHRASDELLFIVTHQAYELWFKEIIFEIDSIRELFLTEAGVLNEEKTLMVISLLKRIVAILKLLGEQFQCLETMTPFGFMEFRDYISPASGFQSAQFRVIENKLGVLRASMRKDSQECCKALRTGKDQTDYVKSEESPSLLEVVEKWLSRTPGLEEDGFNFWGKFKASVYRWLDSLKMQALAQKNEFLKADMLKNFKSTTDTFESIFNEERHNQLVTRGERRFCYKAFQGAMMIYFYRDQPRFHQPFQILQLLIDIDSLIIKWRYNHLMLVQRTIGTKAGTGGSSGYQYLRSTISDRYKVFIDLFHLSNFLVPREYIPHLTRDMKTVLRQVHNHGESDSAHYSDSENEELGLTGLA
ncbi:tryptophan 2,3-dioxygenase-like [Actinia tenebrosa]|uniref:Tryptophan 2,3-dioxygenase n=1 Tax=Actinia tenebrosa TaxID=6105 RepID=A0A6P8H261_ACTTE|nr:tryptophan 2,3-dioxygenase-like [Actinia tenebrosa]